MFLGGIFRTAYDQREKRVGDIGNHDSDGMSAALRQTASQQVGTVTEFLNRRIYALLKRFADMTLIVDNGRDGENRYARFFGDVVDAGRLVRLSLTGLSFRRHILVRSGRGSLPGKRASRGMLRWLLTFIISRASEDILSPQWHWIRERLPQPRPAARPLQPPPNRQSLLFATLKPPWGNRCFPYRAGQRFRAAPPRGNSSDPCALLLPSSGKHLSGARTTPATLASREMPRYLHRNKHSGQCRDKR